jgi:TonB family protein
MFVFIISFHWIMKRRFFHRIIQIGTLVMLILPFLCQAQETTTIAESGNYSSDSVMSIVEQMPRFQGGDEARLRFINSNLKYPDSAVKAGIQGKVYVGFIVEKNGTLTSPTIMRGLGYGCDEEVLRVINMMPPWEAGLLSGKPVRVRFSLPVSFKLEIPEPVYTVVEEMPQFPGGEVARLEFLNSNIQMPQEARSNKVTGTVYVRFVVRPNGELNDISIMKGIGYGCDEEVIRVMKMMPPWTPARQSGKPVSVQFTMPVRFTYNG